MTVARPIWQSESYRLIVARLLPDSNILLMPADFRSAYAGIMEAVKEGTISRDRLDRSVTRILREKMRMSTAAAAVD